MGDLARNVLMVAMLGFAAAGCTMFGEDSRSVGGDDQGEDCDDDHQGDQDGDGACDHDMDEDVDEGGGTACTVVAMAPAPDSHVATPLSTVTLTFAHDIDPGDPHPRGLRPEPGGGADDLLPVQLGRVRRRPDGPLDGRWR